MSTPPFLDLPACARAEPLTTRRGTFAVHVAEPTRATGAEPPPVALLVPGFTGSKEDFIAVLEPLAQNGIQVVAIDPRGQFETPGPDSPDAYSPIEQGADVAAIIEALAAGPVHVLGHSFGGLVARETTIARPELVRSLTLLGSGPSAISGAAADRVRLQLAALKLHDLATVQDMREAHAAADGQPEPPPPIAHFLRRRFVAHNHVGLIAVSEHLLAATDRLGPLRTVLRRARVSVLVAYGNKDDAWSPDAQWEMAVRVEASHAVIDGAGHSPAVDEPEATAALLARFWFEGNGHRS